MFNEFSKKNVPLPAHLYRDVGDDAVRDSDSSMFRTTDSKGGLDSPFQIHFIRGRALTEQKWHPRFLLERGVSKLTESQRCVDNCKGIVYNLPFLCWPYFPR